MAAYWRNWLNRHYRENWHKCFLRLLYCNAIQCNASHLPNYWLQFQFFSRVILTCDIDIPFLFIRSSIRPILILCRNVNFPTFCRETLILIYLKLIDIGADVDLKLGEQIPEQRAGNFFYLRCPQFCVVNPQMRWHCEGTSSQWKTLKLWKITAVINNTTKWTRRTVSANRSHVGICLRSNSMSIRDLVGSQSFWLLSPAPKVGDRGPLTYLSGLAIYCTALRPLVAQCAPPI